MADSLPSRRSRSRSKRQPAQRIISQHSMMAARSVIHSSMCGPKRMWPMMAYEVSAVMKTAIKYGRSTIALLMVRVTSESLSDISRKGRKPILEGGEACSFSDRRREHASGRGSQAACVV